MRRPGQLHPAVVHPSPQSVAKAKSAGLRKIGYISLLGISEISRSTQT
jgi:hypothetical protein